jgi:uncharacterized protein (TIGR03067 family)
MNRHTLTVALILCGTVAGCDATADPVQQELEKFHGTWQLVRYVKDGKELPTDDCVKLSETLDGEGKFTLSREGQETVRGFVTIIDPAGSPGQFNNEYTAGPAQGRKTFGIYRFDEDTLEVCLAWSEAARPTEFTADKGSARALAVYRRVRPR